MNDVGLVIVVGLVDPLVPLGQREIGVPRGFGPRRECDRQQECGHGSVPKRSRLVVSRH